MAGGKNKKKRHSKDSGVSGAGGDGAEQQQPRRGSKSVSKGKKSSKSKGSKFQGDIFSEAATENAYYVCHNVQVGDKVPLKVSDLIQTQFYSSPSQDVLKSRGFAWPDAQKKKKKGRK